MTDTNSTQIALAATLEILAQQLKEAADLAAEAYTRLLNGEQNIAIGTILEFQESLPEIQMLYGTAKALHRRIA